MRSRISSSRVIGSWVMTGTSSDVMSGTYCPCPPMTERPPGGTPPASPTSVRGNACIGPPPSDGVSFSRSRGFMKGCAAMPNGAPPTNPSRPPARAWSKVSMDRGSCCIPRASMGACIISSPASTTPVFRPVRRKFLPRPDTNGASLPLARIASGPARPSIPPDARPRA